MTDVLDALTAELAAATNRLLATVAGLADSDVTAPSRLPGWTRGHVLAHIARNADSHLNLLTWARTGVETPQYPDHEARAAAIEAGARRPAAEQLADLEESAARFAAAVRGMPAYAWRARVRGLGPPEHPAWYVLVRRVREVEVHHVDLDAGYDWTDWPEPFVRRELHDALACWPQAHDTSIGEIHAGGRRWTGLGAGPAVHGAPAEVLAWLTGRAPGTGLKVIPEGAVAPPPWLTMPAPPRLPATPPKEYP
ncbi:maleylpyruvate isomerase [Thermocatellispora tengchongensis]|uniref:Maleylpyruvate isomerase n=1 Tax=Thermocatellispora tengchongensis TaxID=1073253 RepID=A0A840PEV7_9ACTN|nr:maleylpyruvate isomerase family mycothiol-dependent enzyme [Thermocatellispora tengchongensis]MBB5135990.1 maleylpyruvate isomerase [Thermocatellispora tengchongensis]